MRPNGDPALPTTVAPGLHMFQSLKAQIRSPIPITQSSILNHQCIWWDPRALQLGAEAPLGIRKSELIVKNVLPAIVAEGLRAIRPGASPATEQSLVAANASVSAQTATTWAKTSTTEPIL